MNFLEERIVKDGIVKHGNVLKVDSFLNHQMDIALMEEIGREFKRRFGHKHVDKVLTIEASGIGIAAFVAKEFGVPMVFAKKSKSVNLDGEMYVAEVESFTHKHKNQVIVSKKFLHAGEHIQVGVTAHAHVLVQLLGQLLGGGGEGLGLVAALGDLDLGGDHLVGGFHRGGGVVGIGHGWNIPFGFWSYKFGFSGGSTRSTRGSAPDPRLNPS